MKSRALYLGLFLATGHAAAVDPSDAVMPAVIADAPEKVEVLMHYEPSTGECFPDPSAKVRFAGGRVMVEDIYLYKNRRINGSQQVVAFQRGEVRGCLGDHQPERRLCLEARRTPAG